MEVVVNKVKYNIHKPAKINLELASQFNNWSDKEKDRFIDDYLNIKNHLLDVIQDNNGLSICPDKIIYKVFHLINSLSFEEYKLIKTMQTPYFSLNECLNACGIGDLKFNYTDLGTINQMFSKNAYNLESSWTLTNRLNTPKRKYFKVNHSNTHAGKITSIENITYLDLKNILFTIERSFNYVAKNI